MMGPRRRQGDQVSGLESAELIAPPCLRVLHSWASSRACSSLCSGNCWGLDWAELMTTEGLAQLTCRTGVGRLLGRSSEFHPEEELLNRSWKLRPRAELWEEKTARPDAGL